MQGSGGENKDAKVTKAMVYPSMNPSISYKADYGKCQE